MKIEIFDSFDKKKVEKKKKTLREILSKYWKDNKKFEEPAKKESPLEQVKKEMLDAQVSYKSIMDIHNVLVDTYKKIKSKINS